MTRTRRTPRTLAFAIAASFALPTLALTAGCGNNNTTPTAPMNSPTPMAQPQNTGLSGKQKVVLLAGAALLYYIYRKDKANNARANAAGPNGKPQLYREEKGPNTGAIYYRDPQTHKPIWVTAPAGQQVAVPASEVQQYAPDYQQYMGQTAPIPAGASSVPYSQYDPSLGGGGRMMAPAGPRGPRGPGM
ncbi:MAG: hypothetical protein M3Y28_05960 [Armatimonadota bacterium]|nr:hypothetical protein [Armatimonadota bacterium]